MAWRCNSDTLLCSGWWLAVVDSAAVSAGLEVVGSAAVLEEAEVAGSAVVSEGTEVAGSAAALEGMEKVTGKMEETMCQPHRHAGEWDHKHQRQERVCTPPWGARQRRAGGCRCAEVRQVELAAAAPDCESPRGQSPRPTRA